jgi:hypothetical protein
MVDQLNACGCHRTSDKDGLYVDGGDKKFGRFSINPSMAMSALAL